ncbi:hypothetical protein PRIPAC_91886 [Pristionchus pacificus]|nr:hypothetical protein PRIPAC_91886 [Pristionchus pacificus]
MLNSKLSQKICQSTRITNPQAVRFVRARWERTYLKDLYHRRILGADPVISRSAYPNWYVFFVRF